MHKPLILALLAIAGLAACSSKDQPPASGGHGKDHDCPLCKAEREAQAAREASAPLAVKVKDIDGKDVDLSTYAGKVVLIVNVASKCGYTSQYDGLQKLYASRKEKGLVILGFPANDFGNQEPGTDAEIKAFCTGTHKVDFPMFAKVSVTGDKANEVFKRLADAKPEGSSEPAGPPKWNFTKYLIDRHGNVVARFDSKVKPEDAKLTEAIDKALAHEGGTTKAPVAK